MFLNIWLVYLVLIKGKHAFILIIILYRFNSNHVVVLFFSLHVLLIINVFQKLYVKQTSDKIRKIPYVVTLPLNQQLFLMIFLCIILLFIVSNKKSTVTLFTNVTKPIFLNHLSNVSDNGN